MSAELDDLMVEFGSDLMERFARPAQDLVDAVTRKLNSEGIPDKHWPYVWWVLREQSTLPVANSRPYTFAMRLMARTGTMPYFGNNFTVPDDMELDRKINGLSRFILLWVNAKLIKGLRKEYMQELKETARKVPAASGGKVDPKHALKFLHEGFPRVLLMHSSWFRQGNILLMATEFLQ
jgi:hypothetical protein